MVRSGPAFALSLVLSSVEPALRSAAELGAWQIISPVSVAGKVVEVQGLHEVQDTVRASSTSSHALTRSMCSQDLPLLPSLRLLCTASAAACPPSAESESGFLGRHIHSCKSMCFTISFDTRGGSIFARQHSPAW